MTDPGKKDKYPRVDEQLIGRSMSIIHRMCVEKRQGVRRWHKINIRLGDDQTIETLITVTMSDVDGHWVGFHKGIDPVAALRGCLNRINNGGMRWKEDKYAQATDSGGDGGSA